MVVFAGDDDCAVIGERNVVTLIVLHGAFQRSHQLPTCTEHRQVEVVVVVRNNHLTMWTDANADGVIGHTLATNHSQWGAVISKHLELKQKQLCLISTEHFQQLGTI